MSGELRPLRVPCVDTGAGLERLASVLQGVRSTYDGDLLRPVIGALECVAQCGRGYTGAVSARYSHSSPVSSGSAHGGAHLVEAEADSQAVRVDTAYRLVADHVRMAVVCIADGLVPGTGHLECAQLAHSDFDSDASRDQNRSSSLLLCSLCIAHEPEQFIL